MAVTTKHNSRTVAIIPARYASTRLTGKPLIDLCGKPMIQHVYERAKEASLVHRVIVATDHEKVAEVVKTFGGEVVMTPTSIRSGSDRIAYVAGSLTNTDIIVNVQGDEPLIMPQMIDEAIRPLIQDSTVQVSTLVKMITTSDELKNPNVVKVVINLDGNAIFFSRSPIPYFRDSRDTENWHFQHSYYKHIGLYVFRKDFLIKFSSWSESSLERIEKLEQLRMIEHGYSLKAVTTTFESVPVDTVEDVEKVRAILHEKTKVNTV